MLRLLLTVFLCTCISDSKILETSYGKLEGETILSDDGNHMHMFKKVPTAKPPLGELRFSLPQDPDPWDGIRNATVYGTACVANFSHTNHPLRPISEDCLYVNIWTSERCLQKTCAVIVYFHGGGFTEGNAIMFSDEFINKKYVSQDVIFAIPAFRIGVFGQLYFGPNDHLSENLFMFDAVQALKIVHKEIHNFGGSPNKVTIMGHSAGALMTYALGFSDLVDPDAILFQQMIVFSAPGEFGFQDIAVKTSFEIAERFNCTSNAQNSSIPDILHCLRQKDAHKILQTQSDMIRENELRFRSLLRGAPVMKPNGKISDLKKNTAVRNILYGTTEFEFEISNKGKGYHAAGSFMDFENPVPVIHHYYDDSINHPDWIELDSAGVYITARTACEAMVNAGGNVYLYETRQYPESQHKTDMQYILGYHYEKFHTPDMDVLDVYYNKFITNFVKTGKPSEKWEKLDPKRMNYLEMKVDLKKNEAFKMFENFHDQEMKVWFGEMMEYDRNITKQKQAQMPNPKNRQQIRTYSGQFLQETLKNDSMLNQTVVLIFGFLIIIMFVTLIVHFKNSNREEYIPLLK